MTKQTLKLWQQRMKQKVWQRADINALTKMLNRNGRTGALMEVWDLTSDLRHVSELPRYNAAVMLFDNSYSITKEQTEFGIEWLNNFSFKSNGEARNTKNNFDSAQLLIIKNFKKFEFVGVLGFRNGFNQMIQHAPIYRVVSKSGDYFDYTPIHMGNPIVSGGAMVRE